MKLILGDKSVMVLVENPGRNRKFPRTRSRWEIVIRVHLQQIQWGAVSGLMWHRLRDRLR